LFAISLYRQVFGDTLSAVTPRALHRVRVALSHVGVLELNLDARSIGLPLNAVVKRITDFLFVLARTGSPSERTLAVKTQLYRLKETRLPCTVFPTEQDDR